MTIDEIIRHLIKIYPIKDAEKYPDINWNKASERKNEIIKSLDLVLYKDIHSHIKTIYGANPYLLVVGSVFGIGSIASQEKLPRPVETYYFQTGIMFGEGDWFRGRFAFELTARYHKNGKFFHQNPIKIKINQRSSEVFSFLKNKLFQFYEISDQMN